MVSWLMSGSAVLVTYASAVPGVQVQDGRARLDEQTGQADSG
jgi:hypothetical protein